MVGADRFGFNSLMYHYWTKDMSLSGRILILISPNWGVFNDYRIKNQLIEQSAVHLLWSRSQGNDAKIRPYFYQLFVPGDLMTDTTHWIVP